MLARVRVDAPQTCIADPPHQRIPIERTFCSFGWLPVGVCAVICGVLRRVQRTYRLRFRFLAEHLFVYTEK